MTETLECNDCGHTEWWMKGNYFGERTDYEHHWCGLRGHYRPCGPDCNHPFPGSGNWSDNTWLLELAIGE